MKKTELSKTLFKPKKFEKAGFSFSCGREKHFENEAFRKRCNRDNHAIHFPV